MEKIIIEINTTNAAFSSDSEVSRILDKAKEKIRMASMEDFDSEYSLSDLNGNKVGFVKIIMNGDEKWISKNRRNLKDMKKI